MTSLEAVILGAVQGFTEFLPVSSSGHLVVFHELFGAKNNMLAFDILVHMGTLVAAVLYFWKELFRITHDTFWFFVKMPLKRTPDLLYREYPFSLVGIYVVLATVVTCLVAIAFKDAIETTFGSIPIVGVCWLITGTFLLLSKKFQFGVRELLEMNHQDAFFIGLIQGLAILPGISRSGSTIIAGMFLGLDREAAAKFSFWLSIPAILAAGVLEMKKGADLLAAGPQVIIAGFVSAAVMGFLCIFFLLKIIRSEKYYLFGFYCLFAGALALGYSLVRGLIA